MVIKFRPWLTPTWTSLIPLVSSCTTPPLSWLIQPLHIQLKIMAIGTINSQMNYFIWSPWISQKSFKHMWNKLSVESYNAHNHILCSCPFLSRDHLTEQQLWQLNSNYSASLRSLVNYATQWAKYVTLLNEKTKDILPGQLHQLVLTQNAHTTSCWIITIYLRPNDPSSFKVEFSFWHMFEVLWERHICEMIEDISAWRVFILLSALLISFNWKVDKKTSCYVSDFPFFKIVEKLIISIQL